MGDGEQIRLSDQQENLAYCINWK